MYEKLERLREDVRRAKKRLADAQRRLKAVEDKLKEEEATQILSDVQSVNLTPEQLADLLALLKSGQLGQLPFGTADENSTAINENSKDNSKDKGNTEDSESKESKEEMSDEDLELMKLLEEEEGKTNETY